MGTSARANVGIKNFDNYDGNGNVANLYDIGGTNSNAFPTTAFTCRYQGSNGTWYSTTHYNAEATTYNVYADNRGWSWRTNWNNSYYLSTTGMKQWLSYPLNADAPMGEAFVQNSKATKVHYNDKTAQKAGANASYTAVAGARLNVVLPPSRPVIEVYSYKDAAAANSAINLTNVNSNGTVYDTPGLSYGSNGTIAGNLTVTENTRPERTTVVNTRNASFSTEPRAYFGSESVGYRAFVTNNSIYSMTHGARIAIGNVEKTLSPGNNPSDMRPISSVDAPGLLQNLGFHASSLTLSGAMFAVGQKPVTNDAGAITGYDNMVENITIYWYDAGAIAKATVGSVLGAPPLSTTTDKFGNVLAADGSLVTSDKTLHKKTLTAAEVADLFQANGTDASGRPRYKDAVLTDDLWNGGDLCGILINYGYFQNLHSDRAAYVDLFGYTTDSPDVTKRTEYRDTWCYNEGWEGNDGPSVVQSWDWKYVKVQLASDFRADYDVPSWNMLYKGSANGDDSGNGGLNVEEAAIGHATYQANRYGELTRTTDYGNLYAHMPASSQKVRANSYFIDAGAANAAPLYSVSSGDLTNSANLRTLAAGDLNYSTTAWMGYYGSGWRFTYTNYANPTTILSNNNYNIAGPTYGYTGNNKSVWNRDANVYDRDYELYDSYIRVGVMPSVKVPDNEADDYQNTVRDYDAKYLRLSAGLLKAATWTNRPSWAANRVNGEGTGNAVKTITLTANIPAGSRPDIPEADDGSGEGGSGDDADADPAGPTVTVTVEGTGSTAEKVTRVESADGIVITREKAVPTAGVDPYISTTFVYTLDQVVAAGATYDAAGNLVLPNTLWNKGYFMDARVDLAHFNAGVHEIDAATIDVLGAVDVSETNIDLSSTFTTCYDTTGYLDNAVNNGTWDHTSDTYGLWDAEHKNGVWGTNGVNPTVDDVAWNAARDLNGNIPLDRTNGIVTRSNGMDITDAARLVARIDPIRPQVEAQTFLYADEAGQYSSDMQFSSDVRDAAGNKTGDNWKAETAPGNHGTSPDYILETLMGSMNSGWRFTLFNNSDYAMDSSRVVIGGDRSALNNNGTLKNGWQAYTSTDEYQYASGGSTATMFDGDKGTIGTWTDQNRVHNYDGGPAIYGELVDGQWRGFEINELFLNDELVSSMLAQKVDELADTTGEPFDALVGMGPFETDGLESKTNRLHAIADDAAVNALSEADIKAILDGFRSAADKQAYISNRTAELTSGDDAVSADEAAAIVAAELAERAYTVDIYSVGSSDTTYSHDVQVRRLQGNNTYATETVTVVDVPNDPLYKPMKLYLSDYVKKNDAGRWVVSVPCEAWYEHTDDCTHQNGANHPKPGESGYTNCLNTQYVVRVVFHPPGFAANVAQGSQAAGTSAFIDVHGTPTRATTMALNAVFSTDYKTNSWNGNTTSRTVDGDFAKMLPLTAEPDITTYFNWDGGRTLNASGTVVSNAGKDGHPLDGEAHLETDRDTHLPLRNADGTQKYTVTSVPYRWGEGDAQAAAEDAGWSADNPLEEAWFEYILTNASRSTAEDGYLDLALNNMTRFAAGDDKLATQTRGFIGKELQIDGYYRYLVGDSRRTKVLPANIDPSKSYAWTNRGGVIPTLWFYDYNTYVPHKALDTVVESSVTYEYSVDKNTGEVVKSRVNGSTRTEVSRTAPMLKVQLTDEVIEYLLTKTTAGAVDFDAAGEVMLSMGLAKDDIEALAMAFAGTVDEDGHPVVALRDAVVTGTSVTYASGKTFMEPETLRAIYQTMSAELYESYPADGLDPTKAGSNTTFTARIYGDVRTHGTYTKVGADLNTSYDHKMSSSMYYFPLSSFYGNIDRQSDKEVTVAQYAGVSSSLAFKNAVSRPTGANNATTQDGTAVQGSKTPEYVTNADLSNAANQAKVTVANKQDGTGYEFSVRNTTRARSDQATVSLVIESVSMKARTMLTGAYAEDDLDTNGYFVNRGVVRGFKTKQLDISGALKTMGYLDSIDLIFLQPDGRKVTLTLPRTSNVLVPDADGRYVLNFDALWGEKADGTDKLLVSDVQDLGANASDASDDNVRVKFGAAPVSNYNTLKYTINDCYLQRVDFNYKSLEPSWRAADRLGTSAANNGVTDNDNVASDAADAASLLKVTATGNSDWYDSTGNTATHGDSHWNLPSWNYGGRLVNSTDSTRTPCSDAYSIARSNSSSNWYDYYYPHDNTLHARLALKQVGRYDTRGGRTDANGNVGYLVDADVASTSVNRFDTVRKCAALSVVRPYLETHSYVRYGNKANYTGATVGDSTTYASDGNRTEVSVPYAKTFNFWATFENETNISKLDDIDVDINFPLEWESWRTNPSVNQAGNGALQTTAYGYTGFHAINYRIYASLISCFPDDKVGKIRITGYSPDQMKLATSGTKPDATRKVVLRPYYTDDTKTTLAGFEMEYTTGKTAAQITDGKTATNLHAKAVTGKPFVSGGNTVAGTVDGYRIPLQDDGSFYLTEEQLYAMGIEVPTQFQLYSWKDMDELDSAKGAADQQIFIQGYTDTYFERQRCITVKTTNHLDGFREKPLDLPVIDGGKYSNGDTVINNVADAYSMVRVDRSLYFVSKMYYDAVSRTAYADVNSGEPVTPGDDPNDVNKPIVEQVVGKLFELEGGADPTVDGYEFFVRDMSVKNDGYVTLTTNEMLDRAQLVKPAIDTAPSQTETVYIDVPDDPANPEAGSHWEPVKLVRVDETGELFYYLNGEPAPVAPTTRPDDVDAYAPTDHPAAGVSFYVKRIMHDDMTGDDFEVYSTIDSLTATEGITVADFATTIVLPEPQKSNDDQVYLVGSNDGKPTYTKVDLFKDPDGNMVYRLADGTEHDAAGETFAHIDESLVHDEYRQVPVSDLMTEQSPAAGRDAQQIYVRKDGAYVPVFVEVSDEVRDDGGTVTSPSVTTFWYVDAAGHPIDPSTAEQQTAKYILRNNDFIIKASYENSDDTLDPDGNTVPGVPKGHVISCAVRTPATATSKAVVDVVISLGPTVVVDEIEDEQVGKTEAEAKAFIESKGYDVNVTYQFSTTVKEGLVISATRVEEPKYDDDNVTITTRGVVDLVVSRGEDRFADYRAMTVAQAVAALGADDYDVETPVSRGEDRFADYRAMTVAQAVAALGADDYDVETPYAEAFDDTGTLAAGDLMDIELLSEAYDEVVTVPPTEDGGESTTTTVHHKAKVRLTVCAGKSPGAIESDTLAAMKGNVDDVKAALLAAGYLEETLLAAGYLEENITVEETLSDTVATAGEVISVERVGEYGEDHTSKIIITVSMGLSEKAQRAKLFNEIADGITNAETATQKLTDAGYQVDTQTDLQASEPLRNRRLPGGYPDRLAGKRAAAQRRRRAHRRRGQSDPGRRRQSGNRPDQGRCGLPRGHRHLRGHHPDRDPGRARRERQPGAQRRRHPQDRDLRAGSGGRRRAAGPEEGALDRVHRSGQRRERKHLRRHRHRRRLRHRLHQP